MYPSGSHSRHVNQSSGLRWVNGRMSVNDGGGGGGTLLRSLSSFLYVYISLSGVCVYVCSSTPALIDDFG